MRSFKDRNGTTLAVARDREEGMVEAGAQVIDLVRLPRGAHPMPFAEIEYEEVPRTRALDCDSYNACLAFAAAIQWRGFHCRRCPRFPAESRARRCVAAPTFDGGFDAGEADAPVIPIR